MMKTEPLTLEESISKLSGTLQNFREQPSPKLAADLCLDTKTAWAAYYCGFVTKSSSYVEPTKSVMMDLLERSAEALERARTSLNQEVEFYDVYVEHVGFRVEMFNALYAEGVRGVRALLEERKIASSAV